jgi:hypothetical protein
MGEGDGVWVKGELCGWWIVDVDLWWIVGLGESVLAFPGSLGYGCKVLRARFLDILFPDRVGLRIETS